MLSQAVFHLVEHRALLIGHLTSRGDRGATSSTRREQRLVTVAGRLKLCELELVEPIGAVGKQVRVPQSLVPDRERFRF